MVSCTAALTARPDTDWSVALLAPATLMSALRMSVQAEREQQAVERLAALFAPDPGTVTPLLSAATEQGMLVRNGARLVSDRRSTIRT